MATKKQPAPKPAQYTVSNCQFTCNAEVNEHTRAAVEALAFAAQANAEAIKAAAEALGRNTNQVGLRIGGDA